MMVSVEAGQLATVLSWVFQNDGIGDEEGLYLSGVEVGFCYFSV